MLQYIVQPGDTLYYISIKFNTTVDTLMKINHIPDVHMIYPGQIVNIPLPYSSSGNTDNFPGLRRGSTGPFVFLLQSQLLRLGFYKGRMDGRFDSVTEGSLMQFQLSRGLQSTGIADSDTWKHLLDDGEAFINSPPYHAMMVFPGLFTLLSVDKGTYRPGDMIKINLVKINLSSDAITLRYYTSQRYDFKIAYPSGRTLWRWSDSKSFTQVVGSLIIAPGQTIRYEGSYKLSPDQNDGIYHVYGWNTSRQTEHIKSHLTIKILS